MDTQKDGVSHTIAYTFSMAPGQQYRVIGIHSGNDWNRATAISWNKIQDEIPALP